MKEFLSLAIILFSFLSCKTKKVKKTTSSSFQLLIPDTTNNRRAHWDLERIAHYSKISKQIGLSNLKNGTDSFEVRLWSDFFFGNSKELYILTCLDTNFRISYFRVYLRAYDYESKTSRDWNAFTQPLVDSVISKSVLLKKDSLIALDLKSVWNLKSQSQTKYF